MRLGLFGGTFDPVHYGHLLLAETARESICLDQVWFVPAAVPPHKQSKQIADAARRVEMLRLATAGHAAFDLTTLEIDRGGVSYTVDTLEFLKQEDPARELFLLLGTDSLVDLPTWHQPGRICELAQLIIARRSGTDEVDLTELRNCLAGRQNRLVVHQIEMPRIDLSSSEIRRRVASGHSIRFRTPRAVEKYIETAQLYLATEGDGLADAAKHSCEG